MTTPEPYVFTSGEQWGDEPEKAIPTYGSSQPRRIGLGERARLGRRRREVDPLWVSRSPESKRRLLDLDKREEGR